ncbi:hypothetical protein GCM10011504_47420 [Siccirubricoccus deserti]|nr:hypothetical protein GCM10011504_47420 [Siccirubricoccus deserti]
MKQMDHEARCREDKTREKVSPRWKGQHLAPMDLDGAPLVTYPPPRHGALSGSFRVEGMRVASAAEGKRKKAPYPHAKTKAEKLANRRAGFKPSGGRKRQ